jgi:hypothetical protein
MCEVLEGMKDEDEHDVFISELNKQIQLFSLLSFV